MNVPSRGANGDGGLGSGPGLGDGTAALGDAERDRAEVIRTRRWFILGVLCISLVLIVASNASLTVAIPDISTRLGSSPSALQWIVDAYGLVFAGLLLPPGPWLTASVARQRCREVWWCSLWLRSWPASAPPPGS